LLLKTENMKTYYHYLTLPFLFIYTAVCSQDSLVKNTLDKDLIVRKDFLFDSEYFYQSNTYDRKQLGEIIKKDPIAWDYYLIYLSRKKTSKKLKKISITVAGITTIYIIAKRDTDVIELFYDKKWLGPTVLSSIGTYIAAGLIKGAGLNKFVKSIDCFNENILKKEKLGGTPTMELDLQYSDNGIGLVLNF